MESEAPCCAHMRVVWTTEIDRAGLTHGWWKCSDCEAEFVPFARAVRAEEEAWTAYRRGYLDGTAYRPPEGSPDTFETLSAVADARASQHVKGRRAFATPRPATP